MSFHNKAANKHIHIIPLVTSCAVCEALRCHTHEVPHSSLSVLQKPCLCQLATHQAINAHHYNSNLRTLLHEHPSNNKPLSTSAVEARAEHYT